MNKQIIIEYISGKVARDRIELSTQGFSVPMNQHYTTGNNNNISDLSLSTIAYYCRFLFALIH